MDLAEAGRAGPTKSGAVWEDADGVERGEVWAEEEGGGEEAEAVFWRDWEQEQEVPHHYEVAAVGDQPDGRPVF